MSEYKFSIDIGGTFVDAVMFDFMTSKLHAFKLPTTPDDPARAVIEAARRLETPAEQIIEFVHGTTLGLNAILERKGTTVGIITNAGFEDIFEIGRGSLSFADMYRFDYEQPPGIVQRCNVRGVSCRVDAYGEEVEPLDTVGLTDAARSLIEDCGCKALAVSFLHSYANQSHEKSAIELLIREFPDTDVSSGAALANEYREYERTSTAVLDAYIKPVLKKYLGRVASGIDSLGFGGSKYIMNSSGGALTFDMGEASPISTVMSGPAGGVAGALHVARSLGRARILSIDVGGTSLDACLVIDFEPTDVWEAHIDNLPILQPIFDIRNLGAGGGSIARVDNKLLRVGPQSAGAVPGPACYGRGGTAATVTDAALALGYLDTSNFIGGEMTVAEELSIEALQTNIGSPLGIGVKEAAKSIFDVLISKTSSSIREMLLDRGLDPRDFTLLAFGGCGPLFGPMIQRELEMPELLVPPLPSVFSAWGMMASDLSFSESVSVLEPISEMTIRWLRRTANELAEEASAELKRRTGSASDPQIRYFTRVRYIGQEHTLSVEFILDDSHDTLFKRFSDMHHDRFGHSFDDPAEVVSLGVRLTLVTRKPELSLNLPTESGLGLQDARMLDLATSRVVTARRWRRSQLASGARMSGPLQVLDDGSSLVVHSDQELAVEQSGVISVKPKPTE